MREVSPVTLRELYACIGERHAIGPTRSLTELGYQIIPCIGTSRSITAFFILDESWEYISQRSEKASRYHDVRF